MTTIVLVYKIKEGVDIEDYKKWSIEKDQPLVNSYDIIKEFDVEAVVNSDGTWDCFEIVKVDDIKAFEELMETDIFKKEWQKFLEFAEESSIKTIYGKRII
jgi:uncharacterized protein with ACT and thioredoxin-like domain